MDPTYNEQAKDPAPPTLEADVGWSVPHGINLHEEWVLYSARRNTRRSADSLRILAMVKTGLETMHRAGVRMACLPLTTKEDQNTARRLIAEINEDNKRTEVTLELGEYTPGRGSGLYAVVMTMHNAESRAMDSKMNPPPAVAVAVAAVPAAIKPCKHDAMPGELILVCCVMLMIAFVLGLIVGETHTRELMQKIIDASIASCKQVVEQPKWTGGVRWW